MHHRSHGPGLAALVEAGLDSIQLSVQDASRPGSELIDGRVSYAAKEQAAALIRSSGLPFGVNVVLHRHNLDHVGELIDLTLSWGADRLELANVQFYGWALVNRAALMPSRDHSLQWIWDKSPAFTAYRGTDWMSEPCRTYPQREVDFGGCRCQAFALTGDAGRTDPVCSLSPDHSLIQGAVRTVSAEADDFTYRRPRRTR